MFSTVEATSGRRAALARAAVPLGALCLCATVEPRDRAGFVLCPFRLLTGLLCPFCGMTRAVASVIRFRWNEAIEYHVFGPLVASALVAWLFLELGEAAGLWRAGRLRAWAMQPILWIGFTAVATTYNVMRWCGILSVMRL